MVAVPPEVQTLDENIGGGGCAVMAAFRAWKHLRKDPVAAPFLAGAEALRGSGVAEPRGGAARGAQVRRWLCPP